MIDRDERAYALEALTDRITDLQKQRDALAAALEKRKVCKKCGGTGRYLAYRPTLYETDTEAEAADAIFMAERLCLECSIDPAAILRQHDAELICDVSKPLVDTLNRIVVVVENWAEENSSSESALNKIHSLADQAIVGYRTRYEDQAKENPKL